MWLKPRLRLRLRLLSVLSLLWRLPGRKLVGERLGEAEVTLAHEQDAVPLLVRGEQSVVGRLAAGRHPDAAKVGALDDAEWTPRTWSARRAGELLELLSLSLLLSLASFKLDRHESARRG